MPNNTSESAGVLGKKMSVYGMISSIAKRASCGLHNWYLKFGSYETVTPFALAILAAFSTVSRDEFEIACAIPLQCKILLDAM